MAPRLFGTDGIRGPAGSYPLDRPTVIAVGFHLALLLGEHRSEPVVVIGGDTRESTPELARWLATGIAAGGGRTRFLGIVPTPAVAWTVRTGKADAGVVISASHNPHPDNGIKMFDDRGRKWSPEREERLENRLGAGAPAPETAELALEPGALSGYLDHLAATAADNALGGLHLVLDTANGATFAAARPLFERLGARVEVIFDAPDGRNINADCGSTHPEALAATVTARGASFGIAFDGDGDRALLVDDDGTVRDGDAMLFLWARSLALAGELAPPAIVATSMSNLGLEQALAPHGIEVHRCDVGDRAVSETMLEHGIRLGGEQSGHIVDHALSTTGDGLLTALQTATIVASDGGSLADLLIDFRRYPQLLRNVPVASKPPLESLPEVMSAASAAELALGTEGRLVLRYSGTEPLARIMLEGPDEATIQRHGERIAEAIEQELGVGQQGTKS